MCVFYSLLSKSSFQPSGAIGHVLWLCFFGCYANSCRNQGNCWQSDLLSFVFLMYLSSSCGKKTSLKEPHRPAVEASFPAVTVTGSALCYYPIYKSSSMQQDNWSSCMFLSLLARVGLAAPRCTAAALVEDSEDQVDSPWSTTVRCLWDPMSVVRIDIYSR